MTCYAHVIPTPIDDLFAVVNANGELVRLGFLKGRPVNELFERERKDHPVEWSETALAAVSTQLKEYFDRQRTEFTIPLAAKGTPFQQEVWSALCRIPYGTTWSYAELAREIGRPTAFRAVGAANGANPIGLVVPCHRVIGSDRSLTGYGGGLPVKQALLRFESGLLSAEDIGRLCLERAPQAIS